MTGTSLAEELLQLRDDIPLILCSGNSPEITKKMAHKAGIGIFAVKPVEEEKMAVMVRQAIDNNRVTCQHQV